MIKIDGKEYRNLEEQVQANKNTIERIVEGEELLARLGIKVVGQVETEEELPNPVTYAGDFGDAYLIGTETPYDYYIFTRPFEGETDPQWFNLGPFPVAGPQGPRGLQGERGADGIRGSQWFSGTGQPTTTSGYNVGDYYINVGTGNIWHLHDVDGVARWLLEGNIMGPTGPQGIQGETGPQGEQGPQGLRGPSGPAGPIVDVYGELNNVDQLPDPEEVPRNAAYLISISGAKHIFILVENKNTGTLRWYDAGIFSGGTIVMENGSPVNEFNADTKLTTGMSLEYNVGTGLKVYQIRDGSRSGYYAGLLSTGIVDVREGENNSAQVAAGAVTVTTPTEGIARLTPNRIMTKEINANTWQILNFPATGGTLAKTDDITSAINALNLDTRINALSTSIDALSTSISNTETQTKITSTSDYKNAGARDEIRLFPGKGKIMLLRANEDGQEWTFRFQNRNGLPTAVTAQLMMAFIPSVSYGTAQDIPLYRPWIIKIDQGEQGPTVEAQTYGARVYDYQITDGVTESIIGLFIPPSVGGSEVYEMYQGDRDI